MMKKRIRNRKKVNFQHIFAAAAVMAFVGVGCGKVENTQENAAGNLTETPLPTAFPFEGAEAEDKNAQETTRPQDAALTPLAGTIDPDAASNPDAFSAFPLVTPLPNEAVADIACSIAPGDYPVVDGSTATLPLSQALYCYATGADIKTAEAAVIHTKTTNSYYRLYSGEADLLIVYEPPQEIIDRMRTEELLIKPIGLDALVFMANADNPVQSLTRQQLVDIYTGKIKNWSEVGGDSQTLLAFQRPEGSGSQTLMQKLVMGDESMEEGDNVYRYSSMGEILDGMVAYSATANTLGYSVFYYANFMYALPQLRFMGVDGVMPSTQSIYDGSYPFVNAFYAVIRPDEPEGSDVRRLFDWLTGLGGQQMVLDLGYVPVKMPEGAQIAPGESGREGEPEVTPANKLAPGQHYIFVQEEVPARYNSGGGVWIYDENWNCTASFQGASCSEGGITDARYLMIDLWEYKPNWEGVEVWKPECYIYDLAAEELVDFGELALGGVYLLDEERGYFEYYGDWPNVKVIDRQGNVLLENIPIYEGSSSLYRNADCYSGYYWPGELKNSAGGIEMVYDLDFNLKSVIYQEEEDMPRKEERMDGVDYVLGKNGYLLSRDGKVLICQESFLDKFGNGTDTDCRIENGFITWEWAGDVKELHDVTYAGETFYVDANMNAYLKEGDERLTFLDPEKAEDVYYKIGWLDGLLRYRTKYFGPDGEPLAPEYLDGETADFQMCKEGSYIFAQKTESGYAVEMVVPEDDYHEVRYYTVDGMTKYHKIEYLAPYMVAVSGEYMDKDEQTKKALAVYTKDRMELFTAQSVSISQIENRHTSQQEESWIVSMYNGEGQTLIQEGKERDFYTYTILTDKRTRFTTPMPVLRDYSACHDGYLQVNSGSHTYVYDYDGNLVIRAYNRVWAEE